MTDTDEAFDFYVIPAKDCAEAVALYDLAEEDFNRITAVMAHQHKADGVLIGKDGRPMLLTKEQRVLKGAVPSHYSESLEAWVHYPRTRTEVGRRLESDAEEVSQAVEVWRFALERALNIPIEFSETGTLISPIAFRLTDNRVIVFSPRWDGKSYNPPQHGQKVSAQTAEALLRELLSPNSPHALGILAAGGDEDE